ncbi:hypothetical protein ACEPAI_7268 [Sanghuangporus weigelae]
MPRQRVSYALRSTLDFSLDATNDMPEIGSDALQFSTLPGLEDVARVLLAIWDALHLADTNKMACLRLTERCADILLAIREEIHEAGDQVGEFVFDVHSNADTETTASLRRRREGQIQTD